MDLLELREQSVVCEYSCDLTESWLKLIISGSVALRLVQ
jgi:hypothetical protein|tara:strand:- start:1576 stop:1692 length:117 start_codon:yes stop_codon:yes gene_type:complete